MDQTETEIFATALGLAHQMIMTSLLIEFRDSGLLPADRILPILAKARSDLTGMRTHAADAAAGLLGLMASDIAESPKAAD